MDIVYYSYCPVCNKNDGVEDFFAKADSLSEAKKKLEVHEKSLHKGKPCGTFGLSKNGYPKGMK